ncbi:DUF3108 domain-containing protein [Alteromonas sediminis]|nr:DUF3108 domain-containing protein [Alteromonas sediminis]
MSKIKAVLLMIGLTFVQTGFSQAETPSLTPFKAEYTAYRWGDALGTASMELEWLAGNQYSLLYQSKVSKFFLSDKRTEHSIFYLQDNQLVPKEYHYSRSGTGSDKQLDVTFNENQKRIQIKEDNDISTLPWRGETDNQLYRIALPLQLSVNKTQMNVSFINYRGEQKQYQIRVEDQEQIDLPFGELNSIKVKIVRQNSSRETYAWFAPELDYLLVRLQQFKDGEEQGDIKLTTFVQK